MIITYAKFKSAVIEAGKRVITVLQFGAKTAKEAAPFGFDSQPPADFTAIYLETSNVGESVIVGYINKNQLSAVGEARAYAVDASGHVVSFIWAKNDGSLELNGNAFSAVRFQNLKIQLDSLQNQINAQLPLIASGIATGGGVYTPTNINIDLTNSESPTVKLK